MKPLIDYIIESRGIVTGKNDWSILVDYIINHCKFNNDNEYIINRRQYLPPWIGSCMIKMVEFDDDTIAMYIDDESILIGSQLEMTIIIANNAFSSTNLLRVSLEHEFQHAFDHWINLSRRHKDTFIDANYDIATGFESSNYDLMDFWDIFVNPEVCYSDHMFYILRGSTYWFDQSESNAFLREFALYLKTFPIKNIKVFDWYDLYANPNETGAQPLIGIMLMHNIIDNINKYKGVDWKYVMDALNFSWAKQYMGHTFSGNDKNAFCKVLREILNRKAKKVIERYKRVFKDSGLQIINAPNWF